MLGRGEVIKGCVLCCFVGRFRKFVKGDEVAILYQAVLRTHACTRRWEECLPLMSVGQHCIINCPPEVCYGEKVLLLPTAVSPAPLTPSLTHPLSSPPVPGCHARHSAKHLLRVRYTVDQFPPGGSIVCLLRNPCGRCRGGDLNWLWLPHCAQQPVKTSYELRVYQEGDDPEVEDHPRHLSLPAWHFH